MDWKPPQNIRATAQAVIRHNNQILVYEGIDRLKNEKFYRPVGGTVEFLETAQETVIREFKEEAGIDIEQPVFLGLLENIFEYEGYKGHEIVQVFLCQFKDKSLYEKKEFPLFEGKKSLGNATWKDITYLIQNEVRFFPNGLKKLITNLNI